MIELIFSIVIPLLIAFLTVYLDRLLSARKERKQILGSVLSEVEVNIGIIQQLKKQLQLSKEALKSGGILTTPLFVLHEDSMKFAQAQGLVIMLDEQNYGAISTAYVMISNVNQCINNYEALKLVPLTHREDVWNNLIGVIEERFRQLEPLLVDIRATLKNLLKLG
jgi:hypothetical protein